MTRTISFSTSAFTLREHAENITWVIIKTLQALVSGATLQTLPNEVLLVKLPVYDETLRF